MDFAKYLLFYVLLVHFSYAQQYHVVSVGFYNLENLFDYEDDPLIFDEEYTPNGGKHWTGKRLLNKVDKLSLVISKMGSQVTKRAPAILGVSEVENRSVLELLIANDNLSNYDYEIVHKDSPDRRGIDVGLIYDRELFTEMSANWHRLNLLDERMRPIYTREQLCVSGYLSGELIHIIVNHWPSRRGGMKASEPKRLKAAKLCNTIIDSLKMSYDNPKIIIMGDFNDNPTDKSFKKVLKTSSKLKADSAFSIYNTTESLFKKGLGSLAYRDEWSLFDQILVSTPMLGQVGWFFKTTQIYAPDYLITAKGKYKGYPKRTFGSGQYQNGYSDHFPVYTYLLKKIPE